MVETMLARLVATEAAAIAPAGLLGPPGGRRVARQATVAGGGVVLAAAALLVLMWLAGRLL